MYVTVSLILQRLVDGATQATAILHSLDQPSTHTAPLCEGVTPLSHLHSLDQPSTHTAPLCEGVTPLSPNETSEQVQQSLQDKIR